MHNNNNTFSNQRFLFREASFFIARKGHAKLAEREKIMDVERYVYVKVPKISTVIGAAKQIARKTKYKMIGAGIVVVGILACTLFPEDATGGAVACIMGACMLGTTKVS